MGAGEIDSLEIKVQANAQKANQSLDALVGKLDRLTTSLGRVNGNSIISLSNGVQRLANSMQSMKNIGTADFTRLAKNISKIGEIDSASLGKAASSIHRFTNSLAKLDTVKVSDNATQIGQLANGIKQLGYSSATKAIDNIPKLASAMRQLMSELSKAPKVSNNLIQMTNALAKLARTGASSGRAANSLSKSLNAYTASTHMASKGSFNLSAAIGKVYATYWLLFRAFGKIKDAIDISSQLTEVQNVVDVTFGNMSRKVEDFAKTSIEQFGMSELSLKQYASRFQAMGSAMGISGSSIGSANSFLNKQTKGYVGLSKSMSDVSLNLTKLTADMASFYNVDQKDVAEDLESVFTGMTRPLRQYGLDLTEATLKEWALKNGLDADIKSMSQAEKTMLRYQYVMANTGAAQGDFAKTANTWANQTRILKQNFEQLASVIGGVFINSFKPLVSALNAAMSHVIAFAETISNALGKIFGWKYESGSGGIASDFGDAADSADDIAGSTGQAAKNIDKMKAGLRAFDELKTISKKDDSSGSESGGSGGANASGGQWVKQDSIFDDYKSSIDSLYGLGEYIGQTLTNELNGINWDSVYEGASNFGKGLANFLNGLISPELFGATGRTIASALNTAIYAALSFGETFDFYDFGVSIATGINNFFETFDFGSLAKTLNTWVDGLEDAIAGFLKTVKWSDILKKVGTFLGDLELDTIAVILGALLLKNKSGQLLGGSWLASQIAAKLGITNGQLLLYTRLFISVGAITWSFANHARGWIDSFKKWWSETSVGSSHIGYDEEGNEIEVHLSLKATIDRMKTQISEKVKKDWSNLGDTIKDFFTTKSRYNQVFDDEQTASETSGRTESASRYPEGYGKKLIDLEKNKGTMPASEYERQKEEIKKEMQKVDREVSKAALEDKSKSGTDWTEIGRNIVNGITYGIQLESLATNPGTLIFDAFVNSICEVFGIHSPAKNMEPYGKNILLGLVKGFSNSESEFATAISNWWENSVKPWFTKEKWKELGANAKDGLASKWNEFVAWWKQSGAYNWLTNNVKPYFTKEKWVEVSKGIKSGLQSKWDEFSTWWKQGGANKWLESSVKPWFTKEKWASFSGGIKSGLSSKWSEFTSWWKSDGFAKWWNGVKWNFSKEKWTFGGISSGLKAAWNNAIAGIKVIWNNFAKWLNEKLNFKWDAVNIGGKEIIKSGNIRLGRVPTFSTGGFPEDGLFMANHRELVGKFSNGRTAVANNDQITQGIAAAIYPAVYNAVSAAIKNNGGSSTGTPEIRVFVGNRELTDIAIEGINERTRRTGRTPIVLA